MLSGMTFVFGSLLELAVVGYLSRDETILARKKAIIRKSLRKSGLFPDKKQELIEYLDIYDQQFKVDDITQVRRYY